MERIVYDGKTARANMRTMLDDVDGGKTVVIRRSKSFYQVIPEPNNTFRTSIIRLAQVEIISWLIGRCEDQMVRAWLKQELQMVRNLDAPIDSSGRPHDYMKEIEDERITKHPETGAL